MGKLKTCGMITGAFMLLVMIGPGCGMSGLGSGKMVVTPSAGSGSSDPREVLDLAEQSMAAAGDERLDYYAPLHLSEAEKHLKKAQNLMIKGNDDRAVIMEAEASRQMIAKGLTVKQAVLRQLGDVFDMKARLDQLKADVYERSEYEDQMDHIAKLISYIEKGDQDAVEKKKKSYFDEMIALEITVVKKKTLTEALDVMAKAKKNDARKLAPKTWKTAEDTVQQSTIFIESFPRDEKGVAKVGLEALRACQHVFFVTQEVAAIKDMGKDDYENLVLDFETKLNRVSLGLNHEDVRYMSLHDQSVALSSKAEELQRTAHQATLASAPVVTPDHRGTDASTPAHDETVKVDKAPIVTASVQSEDGKAAVVSLEGNNTPVTETVPEMEKPEEEALRTRDDMSQVEPDAETTDVSQAETVSDAQSDPIDAPAEESAPVAEDDASAPVVASVAKTDKDDETPVDNSWDGSSASFNPDDLYLSDEERAKKNSGKK